MLKKSDLLILITVIFMFGISAYFMHLEILFSIISTIIIILFILKKLISPITGIIAFIFFVSGVFYTDFKIKEADILEMYSPQYDAILEGTILSNPTTDKKGKTDFYFEVNKLIDDNNISHKIFAKTFVQIKDDNEKYKTFMPGDYISVSGSIFIPQGANNPSQFDYKEYLHQKGVFTIVHSNNKPFKKISSAQTLKWKFLQKIFKVKNRILNIHSKYIHSPKIEVVGGIVLGDDAVNPTEEVKDSFIKSGLFHMLAASGMNVAIIFGICFYLLRKIKLNYQLSIFIGMIVVAGYTCMTGFPVSLVRATIMLELILFGKLIDRTSNTFALLFFAAFLILLNNPATINDLGFKLSFIVTFGLILSASDACNFCRKMLPPIVAEAVCIPLIAQLWSIPIQMYYFNVFTLWALFANIVILPFITITSFLGFISFICSIIPIIGEKTVFLLSYILNFSSECLIAISNFFGNLPSAVIKTFKPSLLQIILYYLLLGGVFIFLKTLNKKILKIFFVIFLVLIISFFHLPHKNCEIIFFSVGDADMILVKSPENKHIVIDTGKIFFSENQSQAKSIMGKYLIDKGISNIEKIILTHFDSDHSGGIIYLTENFKVNEFISIHNPMELDWHKKIDLNLKKLNIKTSIAKNDNIIYLKDNFKLKTFLKENEKNSNDASILTLLEYGNNKILFMGDAGVKTFNELRYQIPTNIATLKVGHHGAKNSIDDKMIGRLNVKNAIISSGYKNFNHPDYTTLNILNNKSINIYGTNQYNAIKAAITTSEIKFYYFDNDEKKFVEFISK